MGTVPSDQTSKVEKLRLKSELIQYVTN